MEERKYEELITIRNAVKVYSRHKVLQDISLTVTKGECTALVGKNGSGKSTLLRVLAGLTRPTSGTRSVRESNMTIGYVPERFPPLAFTPQEFLMSASAVRGMDKTSAEQAVTSLLRQFDMDQYAHVRMNRFSKGMLQKINLIQAMLGHPDLLLLDEPLSGLDVKAQEKLLHMLAAIKRNGTAIVMSVHESTLIEEIADRVLLMKDGEVIRETRGELQQEATITRIVVLGLDPSAVGQISEHPGIIDCTTHLDACELDVLQDTVDQVLRRILESGGSVISVIPGGGMDIHLAEWLQTAAR
ncbi:ABC transporter ATP-binding protein [Paenibacillus sp.]|jgi:ABC-type multidrug transport system ATPase subunit|uniref:ABC transporter ATP-binding protein n=1 Tax=Paenibacillus sp. TaxID=58172 RepID=UPI002824B257|nr:ABC transporter ATP-binding protein [Paenibacillus sp.]MDR0266654.1 ABC transporter ATP-binding protein [Paenibacillus sp.]